MQVRQLKWTEEAEVCAKVSLRAEELINVLTWHATSYNDMLRSGQFIWRGGG